MLGFDAICDLIAKGRLLSEVAFDVHLRDGKMIQGCASTTGVFWNCPCGQQLDMASDSAAMVTGGVRLDCDKCTRGYWLGQGIPLVGVNGIWESGG